MATICDLGRWGVRVSKKASAFLLITWSGMAGVAAAQDESDNLSPQPADDVEEIVVAGTRIARSGYEAPTPTTIIGASELEAAAPVNIADFMNQLPTFAGSASPRSATSSVSSAGAGLNVLNLRALGGNRTLVLLDGRRVPASTQDGLVDINNLPQSLISGVEVVTGGASAAWGSDAMAGVVNFVLDKNFSGLKGDAQVGTTTYGDDQSVQVSLSGGTGFADERGHVLLSAGGSYLAGIDGNPRDWYTGAKRFFNPAYTPTNGQPELLVRENVGFSTLAPGTIITDGPFRGIYFGPNGTPSQLNYGSIVGDPIIVGGDWRYTDFVESGSLDPRVSRRNAYGRISYEMSNDLEIYGELSYGTSDTSGDCCIQYNFNNLTIQSDNAFLPTQIAAQMNAMGVTSFRAGSSNAALGPLTTNTTRTQRRFLLGANGTFDALGSDWRWDVYGQKGIGDTHISVDVSIRANYDRAIDAVYDSNGALVCRSTLTNPGDGCVPLNIFGTGVASQAAIDYVQGTPSRHDRLEQDIVAGSISGDPFSLWAGPVSVASGIEYRKESVSGESDPLSKVNSYWAGNYKSVDGSYDVLEGFLETVIPIAPDQFDLNAAVRATDYSTSGYVTTWKVGATYNPIEDISFRVTRSRDIRAPNLGELFEAGSTSTSNHPDPFRDNATSTFFRIRSGSLDLKPEKADTLGVGVVFQPRFLPGFAASADYYDIDIADAIATVNEQTIINNCFTGNTRLCEQIDRDSSGVITAVRVTPINLSVLKARGLDLEASYRMPLDSIVFGLNGDLALRILATNYLENYSNNGINVPTDTVGQNAGSGPPDWRYWGSIAYTSDSLAASLTVRGVSDGVYDNSYIECTTACPTSTGDNRTIDNNHIPGEYYMDASISYNFTDAMSMYFTVVNVANTDPVIVADGTSIGGAGRATNPILYDTLGRIFRVGFRFEL